MDADQISEWQSSSASSVTSSSDCGSPKSDVFDLFAEVGTLNARISGICQVLPDTTSSKLSEIIQCHTLGTDDSPPLQGLDAILTPCDMYEELSSVIKALFSNLNFHLERSPDSYTEISRISTLLSTCLPDDAVTIVQEILQIVLKEIKHLPNVNSPTKPHETMPSHTQEVDLYSDHLALLPVGEYIKATLFNPWVGMSSATADYELQKLVFETKQHHHADFTCSSEITDEDLDQSTEVGFVMDCANEFEQDHEDHLDSFIHNPPQVDLVVCPSSSSHYSTMKHAPGFHKLTLVTLLILAFSFSMLVWYYVVPHGNSSAVIHPPPFILSPPNAISLNWLRLANVGSFTRRFSKVLSSCFDLALGFISMAGTKCMNGWSFKSWEEVVVFYVNNIHFKYMACMACCSILYNIF